MMEYGLQLYSVRDITQKGLEKAMQQVAELGYTSVEFAGFFGHPSHEVGRMLRETGLRISGTHTGCEELKPDRDAAHANGALFYPICPDKEASSWANFEKSMNAFLNGTYAGEMEAANIAYFETLLPDEPSWK